MKALTKKILSIIGGIGAFGSVSACFDACSDYGAVDWRAPTQSEIEKCCGVADDSYAYEQCAISAPKLTDNENYGACYYTKEDLEECCGDANDEDADYKACISDYASNYKCGENGHEITPTVYGPAPAQD